MPNIDSLMLSVHVEGLGGRDCQGNPNPAYTKHSRACQLPTPNSITSELVKPTSQATATPHSLLLLATL